MKLHKSILTVCQNGDCQFYHKDAGSAIIKKGVTHNGAQLFFCKHCRHYFDENKGTIFYRKKLLSHKITQLCHLLVKKYTVRELSQRLHVNKNTVVSWLEDLAAHAEQAHVVLRERLKLDAADTDRMWRSIKVMKRKLSREAREGLEKVHPTTISR